MPPPAPALRDLPLEAAPGLSMGRLVFGRYRLEKIAGRGGMGVVWRALDTKLERTVALKFLPDLFFLDHAARDDLKRETRRSLELTHPSIVRIYDFLEDEEMAAISMEFVDGATLSQRRVEQEQRFFEPRELLAWTGALCQALDYAHHTACCVHRDLKPGNLMITTRGALKVADFGISCGLQNTAARVSVFAGTGGTLGYMSPQQLAGELASPSDDIYSVGATLYELLTSKPPFYSGDLSLQIRETMPERIAERRAHLGLTGEPLDPRWEQTILACLHKDPDERPLEMMELAERLGLPSTLREATENRVVIPPTVVERKPIQRPAGVPRPPEPKMPVRRAAAPLPLADASPAEVPVRTASLAATTPLVDPQQSTRQYDTPSPSITLRLPGWYAPARQWASRQRQSLSAGAFIVGFVILWFRPHPATPSLARPVGAAHTPAPAAATPELAWSAPLAAAPALTSSGVNLASLAGGLPLPAPLAPAPPRPVASSPSLLASSLSIPPSRSSALDVPVAGSSLPTDLSDQVRASDAAALASLSTPAAAALPAPLVAGQLQVTTVPPGIPFRVRDAYEQRSPTPPVSGVSPAQVELPLGVYRVEFAADGLGERSTVVRLEKEGVTPLEQIFPHGTLKVTSKPPGAEIFCDEQSLGHAPLEAPLLPGSHTLRAEDDDRDSRPRTLTVAVDGIHPLVFDFTDAPKRTAAASARRRVRPQRPEPNAFMKIGRSIGSLFSAGDKKK